MTNVRAHIAQGIFQDAGNVGIFGGSFVSTSVHQTVNPGLSNHLVCYMLHL